MGLKDLFKSRRKSKQPEAEPYVEQAPAVEREISLKVESLTGTTWDLQISSEDYLDAIEKKFEAQSGIAADNQAFWHHRKLLRGPPFKPVEEMELKNGDVLLYTTPEITESNVHEGATTGLIRVVMNTMIGSTHLIDVNLEDKGLQLKENYQDITGISPDQMRFIMGGLMFDDEKTIAEMGIKNAQNMTCHLRLR